MLASPLMVTWRNRVRGNPLARWIYQRWMASRDYEDRFGKRLLATVDDTAIVWDIGANVGLYTSQFLAHGAKQVVCFEPAPEAVRTLETKFAAEPRVRICPVALADADGTAALVAAGSAPTNRLGSPGLGTPAAAAEAYTTVDVPVRRGHAVAAELGLPTPNVVKVDVEGYEWEVLKGLDDLLARPELRAVFVEMHFSILHERGLDRAPPQIVALLESAG
ncbi:MAG TPA: FkbM family methyltransferase, partial [Gammaproteobacteria bacterium]|nr:FkbM family methyltransferase [Gammaproteobacteria bacterium]